MIGNGKKILTLLLAAVLAAGLFAGCGAESVSDAAGEVPVVAQEEELGTVDLAEEAVALSGAPAVAQDVPVSAGTLVKSNTKASIDYTNTADGYVLVCYTAETQLRLKAQVKGPTTTYTYNLTPGEQTAFPLSDGNGSYQIIVYENVSGTKYAGVISLKCDVMLKDEFAPFLHSNQYVNYSKAPNTVAKAAELVSGETDALKKVERIYDFVVDHLSYDKELASTVQSGYLPELDAVLAKGTGICFDYAALMTAMLRAEGVPCKLVVGYAGSAYHAWISVWSAETGWVDGVIFFNGSAWQRMDPTFASSADGSEWIMRYIGDGSNYAAKYFY